MNAVFALVVAGFVQGVGQMAEIAGMFATEKECQAAKAEFAKLAWKPNIVAAGFDCMKIEVIPGKPV
jgi:hypothetical protein